MIDISEEMGLKANALGKEQLKADGADRELIALERQTLYNVSGTFENTVKQIGNLNEGKSDNETAFVVQTFTKGNIEKSQFYNYDAASGNFSFSIDNQNGETNTYDYKDGSFTRYNGKEMTETDYALINELAETIAAARTENKESEYYDENAEKQYTDDKGDATTDKLKLSNIVLIEKNELIGIVVNFLNLNKEQKEMFGVTDTVTVEDKG